jgi:hypothetical protein
MPYQIQSHCPACQAGDSVVIGNWPEHLGLYLCLSCRQLVNIPTRDGKCPGCGYEPRPDELYDYSRAIPYLGGQMPYTPDSGPVCPRCEGGALQFHNTAHYNMMMVVGNEAGAKATWGRDYVEKAIFMNSTFPVIQEHRLDPRKVFAYFHLDMPSAPLITRSVSYPIALDIRTHLLIHITMNPAAFREGAPPQ